MKKHGGVSSSAALQQIIRYAAFFVSMLVGIYVAAVMANVLPSPGYDISVLVGTSLSLIWVATGVIQYKFFSTSRLNVAIRMTWFHVLVAAQLLLTAGVTQRPLISCWIILSVGVYVYYRFYGLFLNLATLWLVVLLGIIIGNYQPDQIEQSILTALSISITAAIIVLFVRVQET